MARHPAGTRTSPPQPPALSAPRLRRSPPGEAAIDRRPKRSSSRPRILFALPVEGLMIGVFPHQDHRQQARTGKTAGNRMERRGWLRDLLARPAAELLPHMLGHEPLPWDGIKGLGDMFTDLREPGAAATRTAGRRWINHTTTRQVVREVPAGRFAPSLEPGHRPSPPSPRPLAKQLAQ
jgi:hypothetical protein